MRGMVQTVLGPVSPETLGTTTAHEHLLLDFSVVFQEPEAASERGLAFEPVGLDNLAWVRYDPFRSRDNLMLVDEDTTVEEAMLFRAAGGRTIVDTTTRGIGRDPAAAARISRRTGTQRRDRLRLLRGRVPPRGDGRDVRGRDRGRDRVRRHHRPGGREGGRDRRAWLLVAAVGRTSGRC